MYTQTQFRLVPPVEQEGPHIYSIEDLLDLRAVTVQQLGISGSKKVTIDQLTKYSDITGDNQWIPSESEPEKPSAQWVVPGLFLSALLPTLERETFLIEDASEVRNFSLTSTKFPHALKAGQNFQAHFSYAILRVKGGLWKADLQAVYFKHESEQEAAFKPVGLLEYSKFWRESTPFELAKK